MPGYKEEGETVMPSVIWVDRDMKRCKKSTTARRAVYQPEYELYVIDH